MRFQHPLASANKKIVIIVGGGFAGLSAAKKLANCDEVGVYLIDQRNYHLFQPLLYQVATAGLNPGDIAVPIRAQFDSVANVHVHLDRVLSVDLEHKTIKVAGENQPLDVEFDYVILACGAQHSYFGKPEWEEFAPGLKTLEQANEIRRRILLAFELAENELDPKVQEALLNFIVVGGGPTGVELAGAIADISRTVLVRDFKRINPAQANIILVEAGPRLLKPFDEKLSEKAKKDLNDLGVEVRVNSQVEHIDATGAYVGGKLIPSRTIIWAAGVQAAKLPIHPEPEKDRAGRIKVNQDLTVPGHPTAYVLGDMAALEMSPGNLVPGLAPAAIQEGKYAAEAILASIRGKKTKPFRYLDKGQIATIGRSRAVMESGRFKATGFIAWITWLFVHVFFLIGFKNRLSVIFTWAWSYIRAQRGARIIPELEWRSIPENLDAQESEELSQHPRRKAQAVPA